MTNPEVAILMLSLFILMVLLGFPVAFTLLAMGVGFGYYAYHEAGSVQTISATSLGAQVNSGNAFGQYLTCKRVSIETAVDLPLQVDGNLEREGTSFRFQVLPSTLRMRY